MFKYFKKKYSEKELHIFRFLRKNRLMETLTDEELANFLPYLYLRTYRQNEVIYFTGDPSQAVYIVKAGIVSLNLDITEGFEKIMTLYPGKLFGDNAFLKGAKRISTAVVLTEGAELYVIPHANLLEIMNQHPPIRAKVMTAFSEISNEYTSNLFRTYKSSLGFFDLGTVYSNMKF